MFVTEEGVPQRVLHVTMLGPRRVGKTSLLASLYDQFQTVSGQGNLVLTAEGETRTLLQTYREELRMFARGGPARHPGIAGNMFFREHRVLLGTGGRHGPQIMLSFTDVPGESLVAPTSGLGGQLVEAIDRSSVLFIAIDSPALVERGGRYHQTVNKPDLVSDFVREVAARGRDLLVVLVPLKCEKYADEPGGMSLLRDKVLESYRDLISQLSGLQTAATGVVLAPVQTVGSMVFRGFDADGNEAFRLKRIGAGYAPQDTDQPLRWMLRFVIQGYQRRDRTLAQSFWDWWRGDKERFAEALQTFAAGCKIDRDAGFEVLVGHRFLGIQ